MKVGIIGAGKISGIYLENMIHKYSNLEVVGIAASVGAEEKAKEFGIKAYTVEELLADPEIEMVVNLTPAYAHYGVIKSALEAGKHVYTEKTMTDDAEKAKELLKLADSKGLYLGSAPDTFLGSAVQAAKKAIEQGRIGQIHSFAISANRDNSMYLSIFEFLRKPGGGVLFDYGCYYMTALVSLLGPVARVGAIIDTPHKTHVNIMPGTPEYGKVMDTPNESQVSAVIQLENGLNGTFHIDADSNMNDEAFFVIYGSKGILHLSNPNFFGGDVYIHENYLNPDDPKKPVKLMEFTPYSENARGIGPSDMANAIAERKKNRASKEMAFHVLETLEAMLRADSKGSFKEIESTFTMPEALKNSIVPIKNIGHVSLQMKNNEKMIHFYSEVLGMKKAFDLTVADNLKSFADMLKNNPELASKYAGEDISNNEDKLKELEFAIDQESAKQPVISYFKLSDHQFIELFYELNDEHKLFEDRAEYYGYKKMNYEVDHIEEIREKLVKAGVELKEDIHDTCDGAREIAVLDPDGNELQFTEYAKNGEGLLKLADDNRAVYSSVKYTTQVAYQVKDGINMENFYCLGLGLKKAASLTVGDLCDYLLQTHMIDEQSAIGLRMMADQSWIDYIEVAPHQYIELFHDFGGPEKKVEKNLAPYAGYQHLCLEVSDIHEAWDAVTSNGIKPDTEITLGADGAWQFWLVDPDGNRLELMEYADGARQLM